VAPSKISFYYIPETRQPQQAAFLFAGRKSKESRMSEIINIEIQADKSAADEALGQVKKSLDAGKQAADALSHVLDGDLSGAFKSLGELGKTLGITLDLAFSPLDVLAFVKAVADLGEKLSTLLSDTFIYTDAQKAEDKALKTSNDTLVLAAARVKALGRETQIAAEKTEAGKEKLRLQFKLEDLGGDPAALHAKLEKAKADLADAKKAVSDLQKAEENADPEDLRDFDKELEEANAKVGTLSNTVNEYAATLRVADAETKKTGQAISNDMAAQAKATSQAEIAGRMQRNEAALALERSKWNAIKALVKTSADENEAIETGFENRDFQIKSRALQERLELAKKDPDNPAQAVAIQKQVEALALQHQAALNNIRAQGITARHQQDEQQKADLEKQTAAIIANAKAENDADSKAAAEQLKVWDETYNGEIEKAKGKSEAKIQLIEQEFEKGKITQQQEIAAIAKEKEDELALEALYQRKRQSLWDKDPVKVQEIENQIIKIKAQSDQIAAKAQTDSIKLQEKNIDQVFSKIKSGMDQTIRGMLTGTENFSKAWQQMWSGMVVSMVEKLADMMLKWVEHHVALLVIHATEKEGEVAAEASASAQSKSISFADAIAKIHHNAAAAASGVYKAESSLGPVIAGLLAAGTYTAVLGFGAMASAEGGQYYVPNNQLTMLHPQEMVLPAGIANQMRSVIGGGGGGGGGTTVIVNHSVNAVDAASFQQHIRRHSNMIANEVTRALKRKA
jgi:hypothetical protein